MRRVLLVLVLLVGCSADDPAPGPAPSSISRAAFPNPRTEVAGTSWQGAIVIAGGYLADGTSSAQVDRYDPATDAWSRLADLPEPRNHAQLAVLADRLYVIGGSAPNDAIAKVWSLGAGESQWRREPDLLEARSAAAVGVVAGTLVVFGGAVGGRPLASTELLAPGDTSWRRGPPLGAAREHLGGTVAAGRVYAVGGRARGLEGNTALVESYAPGDTAWRREPPLVHARGGNGAGTDAGRPCAVGGEEPGGTIGPVECLEGDTWRVLTTLAEPRHGVAVVALPDGLHAIGGGQTPGLSVSGAHEVLLAQE